MCSGTQKGVCVQDVVDRFKERKEQIRLAAMGNGAEEKKVAEGEMKAVEEKIITLVTLT